MKKKKKTNNLKRASALFVILSLTWIIGMYMYVTYNKIEINTPNYSTEKLSSTIGEETVENIQKNSQKVSDVIEDVNSILSILVIISPSFKSVESAGPLTIIFATYIPWEKLELLEFIYGITSLS